mgnify:CR=1 FL=1
MKKIKVSFDTWIQLLGMLGVLGGLVFVGLEMQQSQTIALGAQQQAQSQAQLGANQQLAYQQAYQPLQAAQQYGSGVMGLISGYPQRESTSPVAPAPSPLSTALGVGSTLAGIYRAINPAPKKTI